MSDDDLARRAVACKGWRWMPGMLTLPFHEDGDRCAPVCHPPWRVTRDGVAGPWAHDATWGALPDFSDPATLGCVLALVREAHGAASVVYLPRDGAIRAWRVVTYAHGADWLTPARYLGEGATEAEALVAALESAP
jgi:hypothetical protein